MSWEYDTCLSILIKDLIPTYNGLKDVLQIELLVFLILSNTDFSGGMYNLSRQVLLLVWGSSILSSFIHPSTTWGKDTLLLTTYTCYSLMCGLGWLGCPPSTVIVSFMCQLGWVVLPKYLFKHYFGYVLGCFLFHVLKKYFLIIVDT